MTETTLKNTSSAKIVSARIPMVDYIEFLKQATNDNLSITDFLIMKLYQEDKVKELTKALSEAENKQKEISELCEEYRGYIDGWKADAEKKGANEKKLQSEVTSLKQQINALNEAEKRNKGEISADSKTITQLKAEITKLQGEKKQLSEIITKWAQSYDALKALCRKVWDEVYTHNKSNIFYDLELEKIVNKLK